MKKSTLFYRIALGVLTSTSSYVYTATQSHLL